MENIFCKYYIGGEEEFFCILSFGTGFYFLFRLGFWLVRFLVDFRFMFDWEEWFIYYIKVFFFLFFRIRGVIFKWISGFGEEGFLFFFSIILI